MMFIELPMYLAVRVSCPPIANEASTGPRSAARFCKISKLCNIIVQNYSLGDTEQLHCYELLSKMTLRPCSGQPRVP